MSEQPIVNAASMTALEASIRKKVADKLMAEIQLVRQEGSELLISRLRAVFNEPINYQDLYDWFDPYTKLRFDREVEHRVTELVTKMLYNGTQLMPRTEYGSDQAYVQSRFPNSYVEKAAYSKYVVREAGKITPSYSGSTLAAWKKTAEVLEQREIDAEEEEEEPEDIEEEEDI